ncbi:hypothetical protein K440DRAFT_610129 [Wilcoxina mikolae CBS 423.85]|nr:hypothetical protein K440DRAFT_610129 [Wilcoxina mikolae CBS 423.85]
MPQSSLLSENARPCSTGGFSVSPPSPVPSLRLHKGNRKALHPLADESEDGYSSHPSIYSASPVGSESDRGCQDGVADSVAPKTEGIFEQDVEDDSGARLAERRNFSSFSGLSMLDTISEQKSASSRSVLHDDEDGDDDEDDDEDEDDDGDTCTVDSSNDVYGYGQSFYYEYASPTQPLHPARSQSVPPRGALPRYLLNGVEIGCNLNALGLEVALFTGAVW